MRFFFPVSRVGGIKSVPPVCVCLSVSALMDDLLNIQMPMGKYILILWPVIHCDTRWCHDRKERLGNNAGGCTSAQAFSYVISISHPKMFKIYIAMCQPDRVSIRCRPADNCSNIRLKDISPFYRGPKSSTMFLLLQTFSARIFKHFEWCGYCWCCWTLLETPPRWHATIL